MENPNNPRKLVCDFCIKSQIEKELEILIRIPEWANGKTNILINGEEVNEESKPGTFVSIKQVWKEDIIHLELGKKISVNYLPGAENTVAFLDGPVVLAGLCDEERVLYTDKELPEELLVADNEREWGNWMNTYKTVHQDRGIRFIPLYQVGYEKYAVYFPIEKRKYI